MQFKIIGPDESCTMSAEDIEVAAVAVMLLGEGCYPARGLGEDSDEYIPPFLMGSPDDWFVARFGMDYGAVAGHVMNHRNRELVAALESLAPLPAHRQSDESDGLRAQASRLATALSRQTCTPAANRTPQEQERNGR